MYFIIINFAIFFLFFFCFLMAAVRGGEGDDTLTVESELSKLDTIQSLLAFDGGPGANDEFILVNTNDIVVDDVLNMTRFVVETPSMGFDNSSWSPEFSYWINLRGATSGTFTLEVYDPVSENLVSEMIDYPVEEKVLETTLQLMLLPELDSCGEIGTSKCTNAVKVYSLGEDAFLIFFMGERLSDSMVLNMTETSLTGFVSENFQNATNDILLQNSDIFYTAVDFLDIYMGDLDVVLNVRGKC